MGVTRSGLEVGVTKSGLEVGVTRSGLEVGVTKSGLEVGVTRSKLKSVRVDFAYGRIAITLALLGQFGQFLEENNR